jgi:hypothetical protein
MNWLPLVLLVPSLALAADDAPRMAHVAPSTIQTPGGPLLVGEGCYLRADVCADVATKVEQDQRQKDLLAEKAAEVSGPDAALLALVIGLSVGLAVGLSVR